MRSVRSITSRLRLIFAAGASAALLAACGGDSSTTDSSQAAQPRTLATTVASVPAVAPATVRMHFRRAQRDEAEWGVYSWWGPVNPSPAWISGRFMMTGTDSFGGYVDIPIDTAKSSIWFLVTDGYGNKNCGNDQGLDFAADIAARGQEIWMLEGDCRIYNAPPAIIFGNLSEAKAHWLSANTLVWPGTPATSTYKLYYAANGGISSSAEGVTGADGSFTLASGGQLSDALKTAFPHLAANTALTLSAADAASLADKVTGQFAIAQFDASGALLQVTSLQHAGMLDSLFAGAAANAKLGATFDAAGVPTFRLWAPTAKSVSLNIYADANTASAVTYPMARDAASGVWSLRAPDASWTNRAYYTYNVNVISRWASNALVNNVVTDPYSLSLNANGKRSFVANLDSPALKPAGWDSHETPRLDHPTDISLYELQVRDFSASDMTVPESHRGKFMAFTNLESNGMRHLRSLQKAGMTHIHLLPSFDIASVDETGCVTPAIPNAAANSTEQQAAVAATENSDCFNWGYDPVHYTAPDGSFATNANDGAVRVREFRSMVKSLHEQKLSVVMDVVYNHTSGSQQGPLSVLDKIVPTYYYRLNASGAILNDSCCADTAAENAMMAKLMVDSVATWARDYKVDSFRFDIMGMAPLSVLTRLKTEVDAAAGRDIYLYGEAWNFGTVGNDARFVQARQANMFGTGIGSFNDRLRDAVRGGGCCDSGQALVGQQGFINGAYYDPNAMSNQSKDDLLRLGDLVKVGLSGTLRDYSFTDRFGVLRKSSEIDYFGQRAGFSASPQETINYVEAHDNQTLFDLNAYKLPQSTSLAERVRVQNLGTAINMLSQGIPFFHAGQEILRSKSMDRDSYNAGDWFNKLDYSYQSNNFGVGMPMQGVNGANYEFISPILVNPLIKPDSAAIIQARDYFIDLLKIRNDSSLFRLRTAADVTERVKFFNVGPDQVPGVIAMHLEGRGYQHAKYKTITVMFNADKVARQVPVPELRGYKLSLHPVHINSTGDPVARTSKFHMASGTFTIPARTTVVFVQRSN
ncbi:pullulanase-type alpha-1,6-glucosidase [Massilia sp. PAMC28688]|uniref:pullulanase-type alpha-1,6-glucosidase n=1 Tax=Massilia sp. PAMC28688 TaxID=2861283 RepID=UPI001C62B2F9|nr:pullulanase-type alpha-1,6-glucosidase [Massilia sp. PAMC28688]QYF92165.1 pullulanase-type alpha-1,6-glucosidase [Massilia sp. PAMC28688]